MGNSDWRRVEFRVPVIGAPSFFREPGPGRYDLSEAFRAEVIQLRGKVRGPNPEGVYEVEVEVSSDLCATVLLHAALVRGAKFGPSNPDQRALYMAGSVLRSPLAAKRGLLIELEDSARQLLPKITPTPGGATDGNE